jgi:hypothetical protein
MKKLFQVVLCLIFVAAGAAANPTFTNESLSYKVMYKWGLINKQAGRATLTIKDSGNHYVTKLVARSEPWADKFYTVRDTLNGSIQKNGFKPTFYEKIANEGGEHKHDVVKFSYNGTSVTGNCTRKVVKKGELKVNQTQTLTATGTTVDMLSSFYMMRSLPFDTWHDGHKYECYIFSGKRKELLTISYHGTENISVNDKTYNCYHITFIFTSNGGKKTSDDMDAWITADSSRIPIQLEGKLAVGKVRCIIMN